MMGVDPVAVLVIGLFICLVLATTILIPRSRRYRITDTDIRIELFGRIVQKKVPFTNIADVTLMTKGEALFPFDFRSLVTYKGVNRLFGPFVLIQKKRWIIHRFVLISPDDPDQFFMNVKHRFAQLQEHEES